MTKEMRPLSEKAARNCEEAKEDVCRCRCGGRFHGAKRGGSSGASREFLESLPEDDPHYIPSEGVKEQQRKDRLDAKRREREEAQRRVWEYRMQHEREMAELYRDQGEW